MAGSTGNPWYVDPSQGSENVRAAMGGLTQQLNRTGDIRRKREAVMRADAKLKAIRDGAQKAYESGDPNQMSSFMAQYPEMAEAMSIASKHKNEATEKNYLDTLQQIYLNPSEENVNNLLTVRKGRLGQEGVQPEMSKETDTAMMRFKQNPQKFLHNVEMELAMRMSEGRFKNLQSLKEKIKGMKPKDRYMAVDGFIVDLIADGGKPDDVWFSGRDLTKGGGSKKDKLKNLMDQFNKDKAIQTRALLKTDQLLPSEQNEAVASDAFRRMGIIADRYKKLGGDIKDLGYESAADLIHPENIPEGPRAFTPEKELPAGVTEEKIQFTMKKHGVSREEVMEIIKKGKRVQ